MLSVPEHTGKLAYIGTIKNAKFRKPVIPGDTLIVEANVGKMRGDIGEAHMTATVEGELVARCDMMFAMILPPASSPTSAQAQASKSKGE